MAPLITVAIVDDHPLYRKGLRDFLSEFNINAVLEASQGKELIDKLQQLSTLPDVCLMDVAMPVMNGFESALALHKNWPSIKVLALSLYEHKYNIIQMLKNGAVAYLFKNGEPSQIVEAIRSVYDYGYYYSELLDARVDNIHHADIIRHKDPNTKERRFLALACSDLTYVEIARIMSVSPRTVDGYRDALFEKLNLKSRAGLVLFAIQTGIVNISNSPDV